MSNVIVESAEFASLIDDAARLTEDVKRMDGELKKIKSIIMKFEPVCGVTYITQNGSTLNYQRCAKYEYDINALYAREGLDFTLRHAKVVATGLKSAASQETMEVITIHTGYTDKFTFKGV